MYSEKACCPWKSFLINRLVVVYVVVVVVVVFVTVSVVVVFVKYSQQIPFSGKSDLEKRQKSLSSLKEIFFKFCNKFFFKKIVQNKMIEKCCVCS